MLRIYFVLRRLALIALLWIPSEVPMFYLPWFISLRGQWKKKSRSGPIREFYSRWNSRVVWSPTSLVATVRLVGHRYQGIMNIMPLENQGKIREFYNQFLVGTPLNTSDLGTVLNTCHLFGNPAEYMPSVWEPRWIHAICLGTPLNTCHLFGNPAEYMPSVCFSSSRRSL